MKKIYRWSHSLLRPVLSMLLMLATQSAMADTATDQVTVSDVSIKAGEKKTVTLSLTTSYSNVGQLTGNINLPTGLKFVETTANHPKVT